MCGAAQGPDELVEDAAAFGVDLPDEIRAPEECVVLPENRDAVRVFGAAATQWRVAPMGGLLGLNYAAARTAALGLGVEWDSVFGGVRIMEAAMLDARGPA